MSNQKDKEKKKKVDSQNRTVEHSIPQRGTGPRGEHLESPGRPIILKKK